MVAKDSQQLHEVGLVHALRTAARSGETLSTGSEASCLEARRLAEAHGLDVRVEVMKAVPRN